MHSTTPAWRILIELYNLSCVIPRLTDGMHKQSKMQLAQHRAIIIINVS